VRALERRLRDLRAGGRTALVLYFVAGLTADWTRHVEAAAHAGADLVEIGIPFSDPMMDGVVIQEGALRSLARGTTFDTVCADLANLSENVPMVAMTYFNILHHYGLERAAGRLAAAGLSGSIVPDLALEESDKWRQASAEHDLATIFLVAPSTPPERVASLAGATEGFAYASARMAVTGEAADLGEAQAVVARVRAASDVPVFVGIGISTPEQARLAGSFADGVIVGSALVRVILEGGDPAETERSVAVFRRALD
jgi:tryptophan synthase alpha chain